MKNNIIFKIAVVIVIVILAIGEGVLFFYVGRNFFAEDKKLIGTWEYVDGDDVSTYEFKKDGTLWINGEYIDKYNNGSAICDNCLTHIGTDEIFFKIKDGDLFINFFKKTENGEELWYITLYRYVKASKIK